MPSESTQVMCGGVIALHGITSQKSLHDEDVSPCILYHASSVSLKVRPCTKGMGPYACASYHIICLIQYDP